MPLSPRVHVFTSCIFQTTSVVVAGRDGCLLVDPNYFPQELDAIAEFTRALDRPVRHLLYTHHHFDHIVGGQWFPHAERIAHQRLPEEMRRKPTPVEAVLSFDDELYVRRVPPFEFAEPTLLVGDEWVGDLGELPFTLLHHPGHSADMLALLLPSERTLLTADMLSPIEIPMVEGDGREYLKSLGQLAALLSGGEVRTVIPGHGPVMHDPAFVLRVLTEDREYIEELRARAGRCPNEGAALEACEGMEYRGKDGHPAMRAVHQKNVRKMWRAVAANGA